MASMRSLGNSMITCWLRSTQTPTSSPNGRRRDLRSCAAYPAWSRRTPTIKLHAFVGFPRQTSKRANLSCAKIVAAEGAPVVIDYIHFRFIQL